MKAAAVKTYFKNKAEKYDEVDKQLYWVFSDALLWRELKKTISRLGKKFTFIDAGGGTGRWTQKILSHYPKAKGILFDLSEEMLTVAEKKLKNYVSKGRLKIIRGNLEKQRDLKGLKANLCFNFHNVIGFVKSPEKLIKNLANATKKNGYLISFVPNTYHGLYFNLTQARPAEALKLLKTKKGRFTKEMPPIHFFTPALIKKLYLKSGLKVARFTGFPSLVYPNFQETQLKGQTQALKNLLSKKTNFNTLLKLEMSVGNDPDIAARGNNLYIVGRK